MQKAARIILNKNSVQLSACLAVVHFGETAGHSHMDHGKAHES
ncbi:hypothetical protein HMPREF9136_1468 [Prevotella dentalis DSM 3688]|uniref:Uncharacterized protein n=1 Tax=Prevotella dentalis (strain ATCC 49559 / DSM 3688 / JCM 13448 / NCTC 12043 / ES 2772) TaxID=908937 RepID=F9D3P0_PREDD|nr:hypothetical protein HMPREF9136_1468 [Prevotella dentalis DSM 3688]